MASDFEMTSRRSSEVIQVGCVSIGSSLLPRLCYTSSGLVGGTGSSSGCFVSFGLTSVLLLSRDVP